MALSAVRATGGGAHAATYRNVHALDCEMRQEALDFDGAHVDWMTLVVGQNETAHPAYVRVLGPLAVVLPPGSGPTTASNLRLASMPHNSELPIDAYRAQCCSENRRL